MFFDSRRSPVLAMNGMVATSQPLAAQAGLQILITLALAMGATPWTQRWLPPPF